MAGRRIQFAIVGDVSRLRRSVAQADQTLGKLRGVAAKATAAMLLLNSAMSLGAGAGVALAAAVALLPLALVGVGIAGAAMTDRVREAFGQLKERATSVLKDIGEPLVGPLTRGAASLGRALDSVAPYLKQISAAAAPLIDGAFAKLEAFADRVGPKLPAMFANALPVARGFGALFGKIAASLGGLFSGDLLNGNQLGAILSAAGDSIAGFLDRIRAIGDFLSPFISQIVAGLQPVIGAVVAAFDALLKKLQPVSDWFAKHPTVIQAVATAIGIVVVALYAFSVVMAIVNAVMLLSPFTWIVLGIVALIAAIVLCVKHWDKIKAAMAKLWGWVKGVFAKGWDWLKTKLSGAVQGFVTVNKKAWDTVRKALTTAVSWYVGLPGRILRAVGKFGSLLLSRGRDLVAGLSRGVTDRWASLRAWIGDLKSKVTSRIGSTARTLYSAGRDLLAGMIAGVQAMASRLISAVTAPITSAVSKAKSLLGIASPSKVFSEIGRFTMQGYADGVGRYARTARDAVEGALDPASLSLAGAGAAGAGNTYHLTIQIAPGGDLVAAGRQIVAAIAAYEERGGRRRAG